MQTKKMVKAGLLALTLTSVFLVTWEWFWRSQGFFPTYNDDKKLWARKRDEAYLSPDKATVFIGSSRIKFDLDLKEWESVTGEKAVQLSLVGTSPILLLKDLADDENFKGKLVVDVTEPLFFSEVPIFHKSALDATQWYKNRTPAEQFSSTINLALESKMVFLEERKFSLDVLLEDFEIPNRPEVFAFPAFPKSFELNTLDRQTYMPEFFLSDSNSINRITGIWTKLIMSNKSKPMDGKELQKFIEDLAISVNRIRSRGGKVIFTRTPSSGPMGEGEQMAFPREKYWEAILKGTNSPGIHFRDDVVTAKLVCPEWSHLSPRDAIIYTRRLALQLDEKGWFGPQLTKR